MLRTWFYWVAFVSVSMACHARLDESQIIRALRGMGECCITGVASVSWENYVFAIVTGREMGHDYCDSNYVFVSKDNGQTFESMKIRDAHFCFWLRAISFSPETKILKIEQDFGCFYSNDFGASFQKQPC